MSESPYSRTIPKLQRAVDATSLSALQFCPQYYMRTILEGWREPGNNDLEFGGYYASSVERYKKGRLNGETKEAATLGALRYAIEATWGEHGPWSGRYASLWRCCGTEPYRNGKGNRAKCPWSHKGEWFPEPAPSTCGECGSSTEVQERWIPCCTKDRYALIRLVAAYCDEQPERPDEGAYPIKFPDGTPAVELSFTYPLPYKTPDNEPYIACGHMDSVMQYGSERFITDNKTTTKPLGKKYWATYSPNNQVDLYDLTGSILWPDLHIDGVMIEGAQVTRTEGVNLGIGIMHRTEAQREEFLYELKYWLDQMEYFALAGYWPMNRRNCWSCAFKKVCALDPSKREAMLAQEFEKRTPWNPLEER